MLSTFFGFGIMLLSAVQRTGLGQQAGLERFLLGKAAAITLSDLYVFAALAVVLLVSVAVFFKGFQLMTFNEDFAAAIGLPVQAIRFVFTILTVLAVTVGIQSVGIVLMLRHFEQANQVPWLEWLTGLRWPVRQIFRRPGALGRQPRVVN